MALILAITEDSNLTRLSYALAQRHLTATLVGARSRTAASVATDSSGPVAALLRRLEIARGGTPPVSLDRRFPSPHDLVLTDLTWGNSEQSGAQATLRNPRPVLGAARGRCPSIASGPQALWGRAPGNDGEFRALLRTVDRLQSCGIGFVSLPVTSSTRPSPASRAAATLIGAATTAARPTVLVLLALANILALARLLLLVTVALRHRRRRSIEAKRSGRTNGERPERAPVSVIVPAYNEGKGILATVTSLVEATSPDGEIIVVDDGSTDDTARIVAEAGLPRVSLITQRNGGKPSALNTGLAAARHELVVMVDADTVVQRDAVDALVRAAVAAPDIGAVSGNVKVANRSSLLTCWQHLEFVSGFNLDRRLYDLIRMTPTVPGALGIFRRSALAVIDGVSSATVAEDTDLTLALQAAGFRVVYEPEAIAYTEAPRTVRQLANQRFRWTYGTLQALWKHRRLLTAAGGPRVRAWTMYAYMILFQALIPAWGLLTNFFTVYLWFSDTWTAAVSLAVTIAVQCVLAGVALWLDGEGFLALLAVPLLPFFYSPFLSTVVIHSIVVAAMGLPVRWQPQLRHGVGSDVLARWRVAPSTSMAGSVPDTS
ncbi:MAG TPA: glycosyltransferase family 2 protein [Kineosporiaceae bacterium]